MRTCGCPFTRKVVNIAAATIATIFQETMVRCIEADQYRGERSIVCIVLAPNVHTFLDLLCSQSPIDIEIVSCY